MKKETKSQHQYIRITPALKAKLYDRATELRTDPSAYITGLIEKDLSEYDLEESEKPRMRQFAKVIGQGIISLMTDHDNKSRSDAKEREEKILALLAYNLRISLFHFYNIASRVKVSNKMQKEDLVNCETEAKKLASASLEKYLETVIANDSEAIMEFLKNPL
jgi:hypothetical protein